MKYVKSPSLCKEKSAKRAPGANMSCFSEEIRAECGRRGYEMASCNRRPFYLVCSGGSKWRSVALGEKEGGR